MKRNHFSVYHFFISLLLITAVLRLSLLGNIAMLFGTYLTLMITDFHSALDQFTLSLADSFCSLCLIIAIPTLFYIKKRSLNLKRKNSFSHYAVTLIIYAFLFAPVITNDNYDFQKDISITRLLPPLSSVQTLHLIDTEEKTDQLSGFLSLKRKVVKNSFDEKLIFIDSLKQKENMIIYYQSGIMSTLSTSLVEMQEGNPVVNTKLFLLGSDEFGRNIFTRITYGTRISLLIGFCAVILSLIIGVALGFAAGFSGGAIDVFLSRLTDVFLSFPIIFFIILILAFFGNSMFTLILVLGFSGWMSLFRIVKGEILSLKNKDYFITAQHLGLSTFSLLLKEALPVIAIPIIVNTVFQFGNVVLSESALNFLGLGIGNEFPSWGGMINSGQEYLSQAWWMIFFPGAAIILTLITVNDFGKKLSTYFNPRLQL